MFNATECHSFILFYLFRSLSFIVGFVLKLMTEEDMLFSPLRVSAAPFLTYDLSDRLFTFRFSAQFWRANPLLLNFATVFLHILRIFTVWADRKSFICISF